MTIDPYNAAHEPAFGYSTEVLPAAAQAQAAASSIPTPSSLREITRETPSPPMLTP